MLTRRVPFLHFVKALTSVDRHVSGIVKNNIALPWLAISPSSDWIINRSLKAETVRTLDPGYGNGRNYHASRPAFYHRPLTLDDIINQTVNRVLDLFDIELEHELFQRWSGLVTHGESNYLITYQVVAAYPGAADVTDERISDLLSYDLSRLLAERTLTDRNT